MESEVTKHFLLVQAVEEADRSGEFVPLDDRSLSDSDGEADRILEQRSERLFGVLEKEHPRQVGAAVTATMSHTWIKLVVVVVALVIGLATKQLGPERRINVLAFPLFGVLAWNICLLYTSPSPRDLSTSRMPSSA